MDATATGASPGDEPRFLWLLLAEQRRKGIGTQLVRHAETALARRGCVKINLQVRAGNSRVVEFYTSPVNATEPRVSMGKQRGQSG